MKKIAQILIVILPYLYACSSKEVSHHTESENEEQIEIEYLQKDSLVFVWGAELLNISQTGINFETVKTPQKNAHVPNQTDTLYTLNFGNTQIQIYRAKDKNILSKAAIRDPEIQLANGLKVGSSKEQVSQTLNTKFTNDTLKVGDLEQNMIFRLSFEDNALKAIEYGGYVD